MIESNLYPYYLTTNDASEIIKAIKLKDKEERFADYIIKEVCDKQDKVAGNGRKTTIIMAEELLNEGFASKTPKLSLKRELDALIPILEAEIDKETRAITLDDVEKVATTASESQEIGKLFQEIYPKIGASGIITIEGSGTYETSYRITDGIRFEQTGLLSPELKHNSGKEIKAVYDNPLILITKRKIQTDEDVNPLLWEMIQAGKRNLVIFTQDMDSNVASMLINLHTRGECNICIIKAPALWRDFVFEDFAKCVGATIIEDASGKDFKNLKFTDLGTCKHLEVDTEDLVITGIKDISDHIARLSAKGDGDSNRRLGWLCGKSALLKLGANSHQDLAYKRLKANDANRSTYLALRYGVVKGGGLCLYDIADRIENPILKKALQAPALQGAKNYGLTIDEYRNIITEDIVDASQVAKRSVRNAIGITSTILTSGASIYLPNKTKEEIELEIAQNRHDPFH